MHFFKHNPSVGQQFSIIALLRACTAFNSLCSCAAVDSNLASRFQFGDSRIGRTASGSAKSYLMICGAWALQQKLYYIAILSTTYVPSRVNAYSLIWVPYSYIYKSFSFAIKIYILIVPILFVTLTEITSVIIPPKSNSKLNMTITMVLMFIFLQTLVAAIIHKTPSPTLDCHTCCKNYSLPNLKSL